LLLIAYNDSKKLTEKKYNKCCTCGVAYSATKYCRAAVPASLSHPSHNENSGKFLV
jgi:hypothetical protein